MNQPSIKEILITSKKLNVLYVEDNKEARESTFLMLNNFFKKVVLATNGLEGLELYENYFYEKNHYFDIVISDIEMPKLDGISMSKSIYKINNEQKIIIITSYSDKDYLIDLIKLGVDGFIQKPLSFNQITDVVMNICDSYKKESIIRLDNEYTFDKIQKLLFRGNEKITLHYNELKLLDYFHLIINI